MSKEFLSNLVHYRTYAKYLPDQLRRENKLETIERYLSMMKFKFPDLSDEINRQGQSIKDSCVVPSMRAMQFSGDGMLKRNMRGFNCFSDDTEFVSSLGVVKFSDFNHGDIVRVLSHLGEWRLATVRNYGNQLLQKIVIRRGRSDKTVFATKDHSWISLNGNRTIGVKVGDYLLDAPNIFTKFNFDEAKIEEKLYWCYGFVYGDGSVTKNKLGKYSKSMVRLCGNDKKYAYRFEELGFSTSSPLSCGGDIFAYTGSYLKVAPNPKIDKPNLIKAFVAGYLDADGGKNGNRLKKNNKSKNLFNSIQSSQEDHINFIRKCFPIAGIYIYREEDMTGQVTNFGIRPKTVRFHITNAPNNNSNCIFKVISVEDSHYAPVWCLEVEDDHSFVLPFGLSTGNCSYLPIKSFLDFRDLFYVSMSGTGVGFSVRNIHVSQLSQINEGSVVKPFEIGDSAEAWATSIVELLQNPMLQFDYTQIRPSGSPLSTGGTASGPKALIHMHSYVRHILKKATNRQLTAFECHRICCLIADCVVVGGVRRGALISLFDYENEEMLNCKSGKWWEKFPELARANNSAVILKDDTDFESKASNVIQSCFEGGQAEPGLILTNNHNYGFNPCAEISLREYGVCNLTEINAAKCLSKEIWLRSVEAATFFGTLQASFTDFYFVQPEWKITAEEDALLGVSITGQAENQAILTEENLQDGAKLAIETNRIWAEKIGINRAKRITTTKPSGSSSSWLGTTAGIHAGHEIRYIRRVRMEKFSALARALSKYFKEFVVEDPFNSDDIVMQVPVKMYDNTLLRSQETAIQCLERMKKLYVNWIKVGHLEGENTHNISLTINYYDHEKEAIKKWMIENKDFYYGISLIPYDGGDYRYLPYSQPPHPEVFEILDGCFKDKCKDFSFDKIKERKDFTNFKGEISCQGGACSLDL